MRRTSLLFALVFVACGSGVSNPHANDARKQAGDGGDSDTGDTLPQGTTLEAQILGARHLVDGTGSVTLEAKASTVPGVTYAWTFGDGTTGSGVSVNHTYATKGCFPVVLRLEAPDATPAQATVNVYAPTDTLEWTLEADGLVQPHGFVPRQRDANVGKFLVSGVIQSPGWENIVVKVMSTVEAPIIVSELKTPLCAMADQTFSVEVEIPVALEAFTAEISAEAGDTLQRVTYLADLVAGDVIIIQGQSNAESANYSGNTLPQSDFIRSWGTAALTQDESEGDNDWHPANGNDVRIAGSIGQWPMKMALDLIEQHHVPLAIFNGSHSGMPIGWFARDDANHANTANNYGRLLRRLHGALVDRSVRAILYFQGESDGGNATGHRDGFAALAAAWREDYPGVEHVYETQVRPGCGNPTIETRNFMRLFGQTSPDSHAMSATAMDAHDGCHYQYVGGYELLGQQFARLLSRDLYGDVIADVEAIDVSTATYANNQIRIQTVSDATSFTVEPGVAANFSVVGGTSTVSDVTMDGNVIVVDLTAGNGTAPTEVRYNAHQGQGATILNARGVGLLAFLLPL